MVEAYSSLTSRWNSKLGQIPSFSLPVILSCPGKTPVCQKICFGLRGRFTTQQMKKILKRNLGATRKKSFVDIVVAEIEKRNPQAFRLHVVGDFYDVKYIKKWIEIANRCPNVSFFGSTRSWRCPSLSDTLQGFRDLDNVFLRASTDFIDHNTAPPGWATWAIEGPGDLCRHDQGLADTCSACGRCWRENQDVSFNLRWATLRRYLQHPMFDDELNIFQRT